MEKTSNTLQEQSSKHSTSERRLPKEEEEKLIRQIKKAHLDIKRARKVR